MKIICSSTRLYLRQFKADEKDAANVLAMNRLPEVLKYLHERPMENLKDARSILKEHIFPQYQNDLGRWSVHLQANHAFVGWCGLKRRLERNTEIDLGYRFLPAYWEQGIASEAAGTCLYYALKDLGLSQVNACTHVENVASIRILEQIGMKIIHEDIIDNCPVKCYLATNED